jgi:hypothetical protein
MVHLSADKMADEWVVKPAEYLVAKWVCQMAAMMAAMMATIVVAMMV